MSLAKEITKSFCGDWRGDHGHVPGPGHSPRDRSVTVWDNPDDPNDVIVHCHSPKDDFKSVKDEWRRLGLIPSRDGREDSRATISRHASVSKTMPNNKIVEAQRIWEECRSAQGTLAEDYLRGRSITSAVPDVLRYHPNLLNKETGLKLPALVAMVQCGKGEFASIRRTYLNNNAQKAAVSSPKMGLGSPKDGAIRLAPPKDTLALAEGIETALSHTQIAGVPTWATLGVKRFKSVKLPKNVQNVILCADNDPSRVGLQCAEEAAAYYVRLGYQAEIATPDALGDFNDLLRMQGGVK